MFFASGRGVNSWIGCAKAPARDKHKKAPAHAAAFRVKHKFPRRGGPSWFDIRRSGWSVPGKARSLQVGTQSVPAEWHPRRPGRPKRRATSEWAIGRGHRLFRYARMCEAAFTPTAPAPLQVLIAGTSASHLCRVGGLPAACSCTGTPAHLLSQADPQVCRFRTCAGQLSPAWSPSGRLGTQQPRRMHIKSR